MPSQFETFVLVELYAQPTFIDLGNNMITESGASRSIKCMIRTYDDKARGEDALKLLRDTCPDRKFDLIPVEHVD